MQTFDKNNPGQEQAWAKFNKCNWDHHMQISKPVFEEVLNNYPRTSTKKAMDDYSLKLVNTQNLRLLKPADPEEQKKWQTQMDINLITDHLMQTDFKEKLKRSLPDGVAQRNLVNGIKGCYDTYPTLAMYLVPGAHESAPEEGKVLSEEANGMLWHCLVKDGAAEITGAEFSDEAAGPISTDGVLRIPAELGGVPVESVAIGAFYRQEWLTEVFLPASVKKVWPGAFGYCENLQAITADPQSPYLKSENGILYNADQSEVLACPGAVQQAKVAASVKKIGWWAFAGCTKLQSVSLPEGLTEIGDHAFFDCYALTGIDIPESVVTIGESAFSDCHNLGKTVKLPAHLQRLGDSAFWHCTGLTEMEVPDEIRVLEGNVFELCTNLKTIKFPAALTKIDKTAFVFCQSLTELEIPEGVTAIGKAAFEYCTGLESVKLPASLTQIKIRAFANCSNLKAITAAPENPAFKAEGGVLYSKDGKTLVAWPDGIAKGEVIIPEGVENIGEAAFKGNADLTAVILPASAKTMGLSAFWRCVNLERVVLNEGFEVLGNDAFMDCTKLKEITLPESLKKITDWTFWNCTGLKELHLPKNVESVGLGTFLHCDSLEAIEVDPENTHLQSDGGILYNADRTELICCPNGKEKAVLPASVKKIGRYGLLGCKKLQEVVLNDGLEAIDDWAFDGCCSLKQIEIPQSVRFLGDFMFYDCSALEKIVLPESTTRIGTCFFENTGFTEITLPENVVRVERYAFMDCKKLQRVTGPNKEAVFGREVFYSCDFMEK